MTRVSMQGARVLRALAEGRTFRAAGDDWVAGAVRAPARLVADLIRADLLRIGGEGPVVTDAGRAHLARAAARSPRLLAERALTDPAAPAARPVRRSVSVNLLESPLGWLRTRGHIDARQFDAGERLRGDWTIAGLGPRVTMRWDAAPTARGPRGPDAPLDPTLAGIAAKRRFEGAVAAAGKGLGDVLWRVVCAGEGLETAEAALGWPRRSGKLVLTMALDRVADYYRLP